ncbi:non-hydrolyzing UDP-N-acetylglucosamine 2-epimerase [Desulfocurvibacter africanus]|uniref:non-hydrolyzing UDP-N-acetylglucosamine 2-epimerase n=1 Tax=Desulfocurvibacter africanus TaxID=873 RepID=UPI000422370B|nr:UDP-N-acetylglucosamine 2-epimerase (non-hydrolyzing) [Desulfocurvibacter africanus]
MRKILVLVGTRPEAVKMGPVVQELSRYPDRFRVRLCVSGQHREMLAQILADFSLVPDVNLDVMTQGQSLAGLSSRLFERIDCLLGVEQPDILLIQGDTTTVMVAALCAFYRGILCGHVEAGLRSGDIHAPFPEEVNRRIAGMTAGLHFAPTARAADTLQAEGVSVERIHVTGNTVIDALLWTADKVRENPPSLPDSVAIALTTRRPIVLITGHRRENFGLGFQNICQALSQLAYDFPNVIFLYPVHLNPNVRGPIFSILGDRENLILTEPLSYRQFVLLMQTAHFILTDSGGIQEEAPSLKKPVLVMRGVTERPEGVEAGVSRLVGTKVNDIVAGVSLLLTDTVAYRDMSSGTNPYGDGQAAKRIAQVLLTYFY